MCSQCSQYSVHQRTCSQLLPLLTLTHLRVPALRLRSAALDRSLDGEFDDLTLSPADTSKLFISGER